MGLFSRLLGNRQPAPKKLDQNDPCRCGSGKRYEECHMDADQKRLVEARAEFWNKHG